MPKKMLVFLFLCPFVNAQDPIGTLEGRITDPSSALVSGAEVSAHNAQTGLTRTVRSSREGSYHFSNLPVGEYTVTVNATGFAAFLVSPVHIDIGQVVRDRKSTRLNSSHLGI